MQKDSAELCCLGVPTVISHWNMGINAGDVTYAADELCCMG